jgi:hypothetical protein
VIQVHQAAVLHLPITHHLVIILTHHHLLAHHHHLASLTLVIAALHLHLALIQAAVLMTANATANVILN